MTDQYILADILESEKNMTVNMAIALNEASSSHIYDCYYNIFRELSNETKILFNLAYCHNWYTLESAEKTKIDKEITKIKKELEC